VNPCSTLARADWKKRESLDDRNLLGLVVIPD